MRENNITKINTIIFCIGNRDGGDDAIGPYIADQLKKEKLENILVIDCGIIPENYTSVVKQKKPKQLIIVDAADMNLDPGEIRIVPKEKIGKMHISTHGIPISILIDYLEQYIENIVFIGVQPKNMSGEMSDNVRRSADKIVLLIKRYEVEKITILT